ncbi:MAG: hypothetical protein HRT40_13410 [Campylobacteraceae bacterium]|nr:hypothetical protein [Campylobacteraceae bacterium]
MKQIYLLTSAIILFSFIGCGSNNINLSLYKQKILQKEYIPEVCKNEFKQKLPKVAVVNFTNNTSYGKAQTNNKNSSFGIGVGISPVFVGAGGKSVKNRTKRFVDPKLSSSIIPLMEDLILQTGGADLFSRVDMDKVDSELKLQDSGLLDPSSIVEFGQASGVQYIITGSLNYVKTDTQNYSGASQAVYDVTKNTDSQELQALGAVLRVFTALTDGTDIETSLTVKIIDVSTGAIKFMHTIKEKSNLGNNGAPTYSEIIGGIKDSVSKSMPFLEKEFGRYFSAKAYIKQLRLNDEEIIAQVSYGKNKQIKEGDLFNVYKLEKNIDPLTNKETCDKIRLDLVLEASTEIDTNTSWLSVQDGNAKQLKLLQIIQKKY